MPNIIINGQSINAAPNASVLETALAHGIDIPRLCYHPELSPSGGCRLCLVEVKGRPDPVPSCGLAAEEGMEITTHSDDLTQIRHDVIDLFISDHPLNCMVCDKAGACDLQNYAYEFGVSGSSFEVEFARDLYQDDNPFFIRDHQYCIMCGKCTRVCDEVIGANAIEAAGRGFTTYIATPFDWPLADTSCVFCGSCVQVCPTAALTPAQRVGKGREWEFERKRSLCGYCGVGCSLEFAVKNGEIIYAQGYEDAPVNGEFLCVKGRFGWDFVSKPDRLATPLIRKDMARKLGLTDEAWSMPAGSVLETERSVNDFVAVDWDTALDVVADKLAETVQNHGPDAVAGLTSARCTNEENYMFQKLFRAAVGTNNIDHCARL